MICFGAEGGGAESLPEVGVEGGNVAEHAEHDLRRQSGADPVVVPERAADLLVELADDRLGPVAVVVCVEVPGASRGQPR